MKSANTKTLWKRETVEKHSQAEFTSIVHALNTYAEATLMENLDGLLAVLQQHGSGKTGKTEELFNAVLNVVENVKLGLVESHSGSAEVLRDVASLLVEVRTTATLEEETVKLDELIERLDFVASGGTDEEVPRVQEDGAGTTTATVIPKLPISPPTNFEDPSVARHAERLSSLKTILSLHAIGTSDSEWKHKLRVEQLNLSDYCLRSATLDAMIDLKEFMDELISDVSQSFKEDANDLEEFIRYDVDDGAIHRSLAEVFRWRLRELTVILGAELTSRAEGKVHIEIRSEDSYVSFRVNFVGLRTAFDLISQRMEELSATLKETPIVEPSANKEKPLSKTAKTRKERIAYALVETRRFVDSARGRFIIDSDDNDQLSVVIKLPKGSRVLHTVPIAVGSDTFLIESHFITDVLDSRNVQWNESHTRIESSDQSYDYCVIDDFIQPVESYASNPTWILLLDTTDRKLALEVETIGEPELYFSVPSISEIYLGHKFVGVNTLRLLLDPTEFSPRGNRRGYAKSTNVFDRHCLCFNVSPVLVDKIQRCLDTEPIFVRHTKTLADTLRQLQEFCPDFLVIEDLVDEFRAVDALKRIAHILPSIKLQVLLFVSSDDKSAKKMKKVSFGITYLSKGADFGEIKNAIVANLGSAKSS